MKRLVMRLDGWYSSALSLGSGSFPVPSVPYRSPHPIDGWRREQSDTGKSTTWKDAATQRGTKDAGHGG